jgi:hypothetical protein
VKKIVVYTTHAIEDAEATRKLIASGGDEIIEVFPGGDLTIYQHDGIKTQIICERGAVDDIEAVKKEIADQSVAMIAINPGMRLRILSYRPSAGGMVLLEGM